ncbi:MAG: SLC13 family permease, partial [Promethearchaeota archaeon]
RMLKLSKGQPWPLFILTFFLTFLLSTVLANVTVMILVSSMILIVCRGLDHDPIPFIFSAILGTEVAGITTLVSSLPAIMVGSAAGIGFIDFILVSASFLIIAIPLIIIYLRKVFPPERIPLSYKVIDTRQIHALDEWSVVENRKRFYLAWVALAIVIIGFIISQPLVVPIVVIAIFGAVSAVVILRSNEESLMARINFDTLLFFGGLFVLVGTLEQNEVLEEIAVFLEKLAGGNLYLTGFLILSLGGGLTGILDNIPVTAALIPVFREINQHYPENPQYLWFMLVFAGAFGGGLTPFGSAASVLALTILSKEGKPLSFKYTIIRLAPISIVLLILGGIYLTGLAFLGFI